VYNRLHSHKHSLMRWRRLYTAWCRVRSHLAARTPSSGDCVNRQASSLRISQSAASARAPRRSLRGWRLRPIGASASTVRARESISVPGFEIPIQKCQILDHRVRGWLISLQNCLSLCGESIIRKKSFAFAAASLIQASTSRSRKKVCPMSALIGHCQKEHVGDVFLSQAERSSSPLTIPAR